MLFDISIHDLTRRSTTWRKIPKNQRSYFNSRPHKEVDNTNHVEEEIDRLFQFTTSQGGRLYLKMFCEEQKIFQFTTSQGGRLIVILNYAVIKHFNSRPHKEVDAAGTALAGITLAFQFTTSQGGRPFVPVKRGREMAFQFTTSQGGRPSEKCNDCDYDEFQFTTSQGGRRWLQQRSMRAWIFQFTTSQGGRQIQWHSFLRYNHFNSRPHKEVDENQNQGHNVRSISIHDLTRRSTHPDHRWHSGNSYFNSRPHKEVDDIRQKIHVQLWQISIHDLTRRSTSSCVYVSEGADHFNSRPHKEVDPLATSPLAITSDFNSRPHKEVDA